MDLTQQCIFRNATRVLENFHTLDIGPLMLVNRLWYQEIQQIVEHNLFLKFLKTLYRTDRVPGHYLTRGTIYNLPVTISSGCRVHDHVVVDLSFTEEDVVKHISSLVMLQDLIDREALTMDVTCKVEQAAKILREMFNGMVLVWWGSQLMPYIGQRSCSPKKWCKEHAA